MNNVGGSASLLSAMMQAGRQTAGVLFDRGGVWDAEDRADPGGSAVRSGESVWRVQGVGGEDAEVDGSAAAGCAASRCVISTRADRTRNRASARSTCPETHLIPLLLRAVVTGKPMTIFGDDYETPDGTCIRDYIHVTRPGGGARGGDREAARGRRIGCVQCGHGSRPFGAGGDAGCGRSDGQKVPHEIGARRAGDPAVLVANSDKLKRTLGWKPKFSELKDIVATAWQFDEKRAERER